MVIVENSILRQTNLAVSGRTDSDSSVSSGSSGPAVIGSRRRGDGDSSVSSGGSSPPAVQSAAAQPARRPKRLLQQAKHARMMLPVAQIGTLAHAVVDSQRRSLSKTFRAVLLYVALMIGSMAIASVTTARFSAYPSNGTKGNPPSGEAQPGPSLNSGVLSAGWTPKSIAGFAVPYRYCRAGRAKITDCQAGNDSGTCLTRLRRSCPSDSKRDWPPEPAIWDGWLSRSFIVRRGRRKNCGGGSPAGPPQPTSVDDDEPEDRALNEPDLSGSPDTDAPLPRAQRRPRRAREDRGLPPDKELVNLARAYLERQRKYWPEIVQAGLLPEPTEEVIHKMVEDFKFRHRGGKVDPASVAPFLKFAAKLGGNYNRFSCDNSNPQSIIDQMAKSLDKARSENRFVPWTYLYADYSVTGLDPSRQGYCSYKTILADGGHFVETTYIDDFSRASRDALEWWKLAALSNRLKKRMIGASDGFDLDSEAGVILMMAYGMLSHLFIKGLREKVTRGMKGAVERGTCVGKPGLGFTRQVCRDANGQIIRGRDGRPLHKVCWDPVTKPYRALIYELYVQKNWSLPRIAKHFNRLRVDGWSGWTCTTIKKLLKGMDAIGVFVWNRYSTKYDPEQKRWVTITKPKSEWVIHKNPALAIVPKELWRAAWLKLLRTQRVHPLTGRKWSRNQISATTLFSGTLFCEHCKRELRLNRSCGKYKAMSCPNGLAGLHNCPLTTSKSTRMIEDCLLGYLGNSLLTEETIAELIHRANAFLEQEARKPRVDTEPLKAKLRDYQNRIRKLVKKVEREPDEALCEGYHVRIKELQKEVNELRTTIREAEARNEPPPAPLDIERAKVYLADLRGLLNQEIPMAAEAIRQLTGPIMIRQEKVPGKRGARWIATFSPDLGALLRKVAKDEGYPAAAALAAAPSETQPVEVVIEKIPKYEQLAPLFKQLSDKGASIKSIAHAYGMSCPYALEILTYAKTGKRPEWQSGKRTGVLAGKTPKYIEIAEEVARLREKEKMPFPRIAEAMKVSQATAIRAFDYARPEAVRKAAENGQRPDRGRYSRLGQDIFQQIRNLLGQGMKVTEIAKQVGCGLSTVYRQRQRMQVKAGDDSAA
mgnify:CR=1 FL=1